MLHASLGASPSKIDGQKTTFGGHAEISVIEMRNTEPQCGNWHPAHHCESIDTASSGVKAHNVHFPTTFDPQDLIVHHAVALGIVAPEVAIPGILE